MTAPDMTPLSPVITTTRPVVVIGAGPTGLAAAANLRRRGLPHLVLEQGEAIGAAVREWSHVRLFSPWAQLVDPVARDLLEAEGWTQPQTDTYPTGGDWVRDYLEPLAKVLGGDDTIRLRHEVVGVAKRGRDVMVDAGRDHEPFVLHVRTPEGPQRLLAGAVIDASPNTPTGSCR